MIPVYSSAAADEGLDYVASISRVLQSHHYVLGTEVRDFEREFASYVGVDHCVAVANGTDALELALRSANVGRGQPVVTVANAGFYGSAAIHAVSAVPVYVDVDDATLTMSRTGLEAALVAKPAAVIVTHLYGQIADMRSIAPLCRDAGVPLIEDCAQAHGATLLGTKAGALGDLACFSFYPTKNLGALGDGGAIVTSDQAVARRLLALRQYGWSEKYCVNLGGGRNSRLDELQAAILRDKLPRLNEWNAERRRIARRYDEAFRNLPVLRPASVGEDNAVHLYVLRLPRREEFRRFMHEKGIATAVHYPIADHLQPAYRCELRHGALPVTESACEQCISLPCFPGLTAGEQETVVAAVFEFFEHG